jgi:PAS domain S-box-containing protein
MTRVEELRSDKSTGRVLLYMRAGEDVAILQDMLADMAAEGVVCTDLQDLARQAIQEDVDAVLLTEPALRDGALATLAVALRNQPHWSDLPILFVASGGSESPLAVQAMRELPNVLVLDQPVRIATLASTLQMALRMRAKQRQVRDLLEERQRREEALRRSEERHRFLVESVNDWIWEVDRDGLYTYVGPQCRELLGYEPEEIVGKTPYDLMPPEEAGRVREVFGSIIGRAKPFRQLENVNRRKDGRLVVLETNGVPVLDAQGNLAGYRGIDRDITDRKRAEEALEEANERLHAQADDLAAVNEQLLTEREELQRQSLELRRLRNQAERTAHARESLARLVEENPDPTLRVGADGAIRYKNPAALALCRQWNAGDPQRVPPAVQEIVSQAYARTQVVRREMAFGEHTYLITAARAPVPAKHVNIFAREITTRKRAEEALRASEEQFHQLFEDDLTGDFLSTPEGRILLCNPAFAATFGFSRAAEAVGTRIVDLYLDPGEWESLVERLRRERKIERLEVWRKRRDGQQIHIVENLVGRFNEQGQLYEIKGYVFEDTQRKQAEAALRESEERLHRAMESGKVGVWEWEVGTDTVQWSQGVYPLLGYTPDEVTPSLTAIRQRIDPRDLAHHDAALKDSLERCEDYLSEFRVVWADGSVHWIGARGQYVYVADPNGTILRLRGVFSDIDRRKQAEESLRRSEEQFHRLFEEDLTGDFVSTPEGQILLCNPAFAAIFGFSRAADAVGTNIVDLYLDTREGRPLLERLRAEGKIERLEVWRKRRDGQPIHIVENLMGHFNEQGELDEIKGYLFEDTDRKQAEEALRESEEKFRQLAETAPAAILIYQEGQYVYANPAAESITGYRRDELLAQGPGDIVHPDYRRQVKQTVSRRTQGHAPPMHYELKILTKDGQERWTDSATVSIVYGNKPAGLVVAFDITARKQAEEALRELNTTLESKVTQRTAELRHRTRQLQKLALEMSQAEDQERERLAHVLHEDLQQELAAAKFNLSIVRSRVIHDSSMHELTAQVDAMLKDAITKSRSLSHELSPAVLRQGEFAEILSWLANEMQAKHGLAVHVQGRALVPSDPIRGFLYRTAQELLFNTVKHAQVQEARARVRQCGGYVCLSVADRGRGFDPEELREAAGFGLLSIRERIELLGGRMKIRSARGQGSTFFVIVPNSETAAPLSGRTEGAERATPEGDGRLRVVLADDHDIVRQGLAALLNEEGEVKIVGEAANGREAVELAERLHPDVVIMDVSMPVMSGEEATRRIKQELPQTRIVSLSMREGPETREKMCAAGAESYVLKTAPYKELLAAIRGEESAA